MKYFSRRSLCGITIGLLFYACMSSQETGKQTSTSVTTGNPTGLKFIRTKDSLPIRMSGQMEVYATTQIPVPGFSPDPLVRIPFSSGTEIILDSSAFENIPDSLWPTTSIEPDSIYRFNVVLMGDSQTSILRNFGYRKQFRDFIPREEDVSAPQEEGQLQLNADLVDFFEYQPKLNRGQISIAWDYYLFLFGTGFVAKGEGKVQQGEPLIFSFSKFPKGMQTGFLILLPGKEHPMSGIDSTVIFTLLAPLETGNDSLKIGPIHSPIELPDSLKIK